MKLVNLVGKRFGRLVAIRQNGLSVHKRILWLCRCDCGNKVTVLGSHLSAKTTKSCGCLQKEKATKHGKSHHRLYRIWADIKVRCGVYAGASKETLKQYKDRGISLCDEWYDFEIFYTWAKKGWEKGLMIDRRDNNGDYTPDNCRFVTPKLSAQNTRLSKRWYIGDMVFQSSPDAARFFETAPGTIHRWCCGYKSNGTQYPPKKNCCAVRVY